jgi:metal-responsive CopG/Arc/MetJ family transcriptional regulator
MDSGMRSMLDARAEDARRNRSQLIRLAIEDYLSHVRDPLRSAA